MQAGPGAGMRGRCAGLGNFWRTYGRLEEGACGDDESDPGYELVVKVVYFSNDKIKCSGRDGLSFKLLAV